MKQMMKQHSDVPGGDPQGDRGARSWACVRPLLRHPLVSLLSEVLRCIFFFFVEYSFAESHLRFPRETEEVHRTSPGQRPARDGAPADPPRRGPLRFSIKMI